jgi:hypothetical protein
LADVRPRPRDMPAVAKPASCKNFLLSIIGKD